MKQPYRTILYVFIAALVLFLSWYWFRGCNSAGPVHQEKAKVDLVNAVVNQDSIDLKFYMDSMKFVQKGLEDKNKQLSTELVRIESKMKASERKARGYIKTIVLTEAPPECDSLAGEYLQLLDYVGERKNYYDSIIVNKDSIILIKDSVIKRQGETIVLLNTSLNSVSQSFEVVLKDNIRINKKLGRRNRLLKIAIPIATWKIAEEINKIIKR